LYSVIIICTDEIVVLFDNSIVLDNSTITWSYAQISNCSLQTTSSTEQVNEK